jgi:hypothetical protein
VASGQGHGQHPYAREERARDLVRQRGREYLDSLSETERQAYVPPIDAIREPKAIQSAVDHDGRVTGRPFGVLTAAASASGAGGVGGIGGIGGIGGVGGVGGVGGDAFERIRAEQQAAIAAARRARAAEARATAQREEGEKKMRRIQLQVFVHARSVMSYLHNHRVYG